MRDVYVVGVGMTRFAKYLDRSIGLLTKEALDQTLADAGLAASDLEAVWFSNSGWGMHTHQHCIRGQVALQNTGLEGLPITNVENACAGGATAFHHAWMGVMSGLYDCALAIGAEKVYHEDKVKMFQSFWAGIDVEHMDQQMAGWQEALSNIQLDDQQRIIDHIRKLSENQRPKGCKKLSGRPAWRIRIGNYRVIYEIHEDKLVIIILKIGHRKEVYRRLT